MLIYNVTINLEHAIHQAWLEWMKEKHIPEVMATGCFTHYQFVRVLDIDETDGVTYAVQYFAENKANYNRYIQGYADALRDDSLKSWGSKFIGFRSLMQVVH
ncbi:MAG: DUF4286 family protein [Chitinophagaceae bacterium]|nr:DUF4286 family protein [Chitinophagaceae bacterium]